MQEQWWQQSSEVVSKIIQYENLVGHRSTAATWDYDTPKYSIEGEIAVVKLDDMRNANGLTSKLTAALTDIALELHGRPDVKVVLFTASGAYFCTGGAFASTDPNDFLYSAPTHGCETDNDRSIAGTMGTSNLFYLLNTLPQYKVASVRGESMGAGNSLICSMDYVITPDTKKTKCNFKEATRGLAACISWQGVVSKLGIPKARSLTLCSDILDAKGSVEFGIADEIKELPTAEASMKASDEAARVKAEEVAKLPMEEITKMKTTGVGCKTPLFPMPDGCKDCAAVQGPVKDYQAAVKEVIQACGMTGRPAPARLSKQMWPHSSVKLNVKGQHMAVIKLCRPDADNAIDKDMVAGLLDAAIELHKSIGIIRVLVLKAEGANFCAGLDKSLPADDKQLQRMLFLFNMLPMYVVGVVQGQATGLGVSLACCCDRVIMMRPATLSFAGLKPNQGGEYVFARVGEVKFKELTGGSAPMTADVAKAMHFAFVIADGAQDVEEAISAVCEMATMCAPNAVAEAKGFLMQLGGATIVWETLIAISQHIVNRNADPEFNDAIKAVMDPDHKPHYRKDENFEVTPTKQMKALTGPPAVTGKPAPATKTSVMI